MKCFCKEQPNENSLVVGNTFNPVSHGPCVHFGTKFKLLIAYFIESKQQDDSFHLFTIIERNKLKSTQQCLSIEYFLPQGDYILLIIPSQPVNSLGHPLDITT